MRGCIAVGIRWLETVADPYDHSVWLINRVPLSDAAPCAVLRATRRRFCIKAGQNRTRETSPTLTTSVLQSFLPTSTMLFKVSAIALAAAALVSASPAAIAKRGEATCQINVTGFTFPRNAPPPLPAGETLTTEWNYCKSSSPFMFSYII